MTCPFANFLSAGGANWGLYGINIHFSWSILPPVVLSFMTLHFHHLPLPRASPLPYKFSLAPQLPISPTFPPRSQPIAPLPPLTHISILFSTLVLVYVFIFHIQIHSYLLFHRYHPFPFCSPPVFRSTPLPPPLLPTTTILSTTTTLSFSLEVVTWPPLVNSGAGKREGASEVKPCSGRHGVNRPLALPSRPVF